MGSKWERVTLENAITFQRGHDLPKTNMVAGKYPVVGSSGVIGYHDKYTTKAPSITVGRSGHGVGRLFLCKETSWSHNTTLYIKDFKNNDPYFIFYLLQTLNLSHYSGGSAVPTLNRNHIHTIPILLPPLEEQKRIAAILSAFDDKITLNQEMNKTLEAMAQALFKSWFVDFEPVKAKMRGEQPQGMSAEVAKLFPSKLVESELGLIPDGWEVSNIGNEVEVVGGGTPSTKELNFWENGDINWTSPKDLSGLSDKILMTTASKITQAGLQKISSGLLPVDTVLLSSRAPIGYLALAKIPVAINQGYIAMKCQKRLSAEYILQWCTQNMENIKQVAGGTTFAEVSKSSFKPLKILVPHDEIIKYFKLNVQKCYNKIHENMLENVSLQNLRDSTLPKLINGEINV